MSTTESISTTQGTEGKPLRAWPLPFMLGGMLLAKYLPILVQDGPSYLWMSAAFGPILISLLIVVWWLIASRARWFERIIGAVAILGLLILAGAIADPSMRGPAMMAMTIPLGVASFAITLFFLRNRRQASRTWIALVFAAIGFFTTALFKSDGMWGDFAVGLQWRWKPTAEDALAQQGNAPKSGSASMELSLIQDSLAKQDWPRFRGPNSNSSQPGVTINKDWKANPPKQLWKNTIGPAWSSMVVSGDLLFTQEQRGESEATVCYRASDGKQVWVQETPSRFFETLGGLGPRATPTLSGESLFTLGAEGWLQKLDAKDGAVQWKADLREIAKRSPPMWGFSSSPCVYQDMVIVFAGSEEQGIIAFDASNGSVRWSARCGQDSYGSVQAIRVLDQEYLAILSNEGLHLYDPVTGAVRLRHDWPHQGYRSLQPQLIDADKLLIPTGLGSGTRLIQMTNIDGRIEANELWTSRKLKPDFNDCVVHQGHVYGFDDGIFACIRVDDGEKAWKSGRYGKGQVLLLPDCGALIVQAETGEIVLLDADPKESRELGRIQAMTSKSWNHPVVVGKKLFARTADEMVCFELP